MSTANIIGVYHHPHYRDVYIVEMLIATSPDSIDFSSFYCVDPNLPKSDWQTVFGEHFLSSDGDFIIGDGIDKPRVSSNEARVVFGLYAEGLDIPLSTPYGELALSSPEDLPARLKNAALNICLD